MNGNKIEVTCVLPSALIDELIQLPRRDLLTCLYKHGGEEGGSIRLDDENQLQDLLLSLPEPTRSSAGGSAANSARALASIFGLQVGVLTARGDDSAGATFLHSLDKAHVRTDKVKVISGGRTGRSLILAEVESGQRTMRTFLGRDKGVLKPEMISASDFEHSQWSLISLYSIYVDGLVMAALKSAKDAGSKVIVDLASKEIVSAHRDLILNSIIVQGFVDSMIMNEDEAMALGLGSTPQEICSQLTSLCPSMIVVITLGKNGCYASRGVEQIQHPALEGVMAIDSSGCGDAFTAGFIFGLVSNLPLIRCCEIATCCGAAAVQQIGAELTLSSIRFIHEKMHSNLAASSVETLPLQALHRELVQAHALVEQIGRGVVVFGSARLNPSSPFYSLTSQLAQEVSSLLRVPLWTGGGPGLMRAAAEGALSIGGKVGAIKIGREAGSSSSTSSVLSADYLPPCSYVVCQHMPIRKAALTDAGVRVNVSDRTAFIFVPGGLGTMDELFSLLTLFQLKKIDTRPVPILALNYDGFFNGLTHMLDSLCTSGVMEHSEHNVRLSKDNADAISYLKEFYQVE